MYKGCTMVDFEGQRVALHMLAKLTGIKKSTIYTRYHRQGMRGPLLWAPVSELRKRRGSNTTKRELAEQCLVAHNEEYQQKLARRARALDDRDAAFAPPLIDASLLSDHERAHIRTEVRRGISAQAGAKGFKAWRELQE